MNDTLIGAFAISFAYASTYVPLIEPVASSAHAALTPTEGIAIATAKIPFRLMKG
jgi:hypothetical protein